MKAAATGMPLSADKPLSVAILALGGQGGGVLSDWIVQLAEAEGWAVQATSVPGVAQRTGATIYYLELLRPHDGKQPVFSLMPTPGEVDIVLAAELMEAGRALLRGLVSPSRTTLIASSHRSLAVVEKMVPGDGISDPRAVMDAAEIAAKKIIAFDMNLLAESNGTVISAVMFGALAASEALPFPRDAYVEAIRAGGKGVEASVRAFSVAYDRVRQSPRDPIARTVQKTMPSVPTSAAHPELSRLLGRILGKFPAQCQSMLFAGISRLVDYQDVAYAAEYLDRMEKLCSLDAAGAGSAHGFAFTTEAAKHLAVAMAYDDVIRVADLKTRAGRSERIRREIGVKPDQVLHTTEYMHPRLEEVLGVLPVGLARWIQSRPRLCAALDRRINHGRRIRTDTMPGFLLLYAVGRAKFLRRRSLRHRQESAHTEKWLATATEHLKDSYELATEIIACRRLIKGYSDTHARGLSKFERVLTVVPRLVSLPDSAGSLRRLKQAALQDESGEALSTALADLERA
jgi:indolepyruvate ferredoxin oxidoreductase beta subunit